MFHPALSAGKLLLRFYLESPDASDLCEKVKARRQRAFAIAASE